MQNHLSRRCKAQLYVILSNYSHFLSCYDNASLLISVPGHFGSKCAGMWWGYSSALDLLDECDLTSSTEDGSADGGLSNENGQITINALLVCQSDNRHVLQTLAKRYQHKENVQMNLYVYESLLENVARDLLFLVMALQTQESIGLSDKTKFFMELFGNTLIRPTTSNYLMSTSKELLRMITDTDFTEQIMPCLSLDNLKYRERDQLEIILKYWSSKDETFDVLTSWDNRLRKSLGVRYDSRLGVFDWDFHMRYRSYGADVLNIQEYKRFREKGIAFYQDDTDPCTPNRSLASAIASVGSNIISCGYLGDIVTGPYPVFGFDCDDPKLLEKVNGMPKKTATDVTEYNVMRVFHEIAHSKPFCLDHSKDETYAFITQDITHKLQIKSRPPDEGDDVTIRKKLPKFELMPVDGVKIIVLPTTSLKEFLMKPKYERFFDIMTFPQVMVLTSLTRDLVRLVKQTTGRIVIDTPKYLLSFRKEDLAKYKSDLETMMTGFGCERLSRSFSYEKDEFLRFRVVK